MSGDPCSALWGSMKTACENMGKTLSGGGSGGSLDDLVLHPLANSTAGSANSALEQMLTWWMNFPTVDLNGSGVLGLRPISLFLASVVGIILLISQAFKAIVRRKGTPLLEAAIGVIKLAFWIAVGEGLLVSVLGASDGLTQWIKTLGFGDLSNTQVSSAFTAVSLQNLPAGEWVLVVVIALADVVIGVFQLGLMFVRQAAIPVQVALVPIGAAGQIGSEGSTSYKWLPKLLASIGGVAAYKPMAMFVLAVGYREMAAASGIAQAVLGLVTMLLSVIALPSMIRIFAPLVGSAHPSGSAGLLAVAGEALMLRRMSSGGQSQSAGADNPSNSGGGSTSAAAQAAAMNNSGPAAKDSPGAQSPTGAGATATGGTSGANNTATSSGAGSQGADGSEGSASTGGQGAENGTGAARASAQHSNKLATAILTLKALDAVRSKAANTATEWSKE